MCRFFWGKGLQLAIYCGSSINDCFVVSKKHKIAAAAKLKIPNLDLRARTPDSKLLERSVLYSRNQCHYKTCVKLIRYTFEFASRCHWRGTSTCLLFRYRCTTSKYFETKVGSATLLSSQRYYQFIQAKILISRKKQFPTSRKSQWVTEKRIISSVKQ